MTAPPDASTPPAIVQPARSLFETARDVRLDRAFVPSAERRQGEVRLIRREGRGVVQTLLDTKVLKRVVAAIAGKERRNWPEGAEGHADMLRYVEALERRARAEAPAPPAAAAPSGAPVPTPAPAPADGGRRRRLLIEFVDDARAPFVAIGGVRLEEIAGETIIREREQPVVLDLAAAYVRRNMVLILADAFKVPVEEAAARLARASAP